MTKPRAPFGPRASADWFRIEAKVGEGEATASADIYIYEQIGYDWWTDSGVTAKSFAATIAGLDVDTIRLHLNSPGGLAFDGLTIMNSLRDHKARVEVTVDGLAASAASVIAMAGDLVTMNRGAQMMIHDASTVAWGNAEEIGKTVTLLDKLSDSIADTYTAKAGNDRAHWRALMQAETWYTAEEAVAAGLADKWVDAPEEDAAQAVARFDLSALAFAYAGRDAAPAPQMQAPEPPASTEPGDSNRKELLVSDSLKAGLRERLGVTDAEASEETLLAALDEALTEQADTTAAPAATTVPEGAVLMDAAALEELRSNAALGAEARRAQDSARRDSVVDKAVNEGRIGPSARATWRAQMDKDEEGVTALLNSFEANTVPVTEVGHSDTVNSADDALYAAAGWGQTEKEA